MHWSLREVPETGFSVNPPALAPSTGEFTENATCRALRKRRLIRASAAINLCLQSTVDRALEIYHQLTLGLESDSLLGIDFVEFPGLRDRRRVAPILGISRVAKCRALALDS